MDSLSIITQVALGFIAFVIGNEFRLTTLENMGRQAITVGILQAVVTTALVDLALVVLHLLRPDVISMASAITLGAIAAATAPAATLMVVKQYKANGPLTHLLLMVVAIDDAVGLVLFSASFGVANALEQGRIDPLGVIVEPLVEIVLSLGLGALAGFVLNQLEIYFHSRSKRMSLSVAFVLLTVGLSMVTFQIGPVHCGFSLLLVCMMTGTVFCNICPTSDELMDRLDRWVSPVNILFFVLSGAELDLNILSNPLVLLIGVVYIVSRSLGKISGSYFSCRATRCSDNIQKYLGITLLPQAGVALGMAAEAAELSDGHMVRNVVLFSVLVYELVGPTLTKVSLTAAGEIEPEAAPAPARPTNPKLRSHWTDKLDKQKDLSERSRRGLFSVIRLTAEQELHVREGPLLAEVAHHFQQLFEQGAGLRVEHIVALAAVVIFPRRGVGVPVAQIDPAGRDPVTDHLADIA